MIKNLKIKNKLLISFILFSFLILFWLGYSKIITNWPEQNHLRVIYLDIGQGDAVLIQTPDNKNILIDGGPDQTILFKLDRYLKLTNNQIDLLILTHCDPDHLNGLVEVLERKKVKQVVFNGRNNYLPGFQKMQEIIQSKQIPIYAVQTKETINLGLIKLEFFWPNQRLIDNSKKRKDNFYSLVFKMEYNNYTFLFTGDADQKAEQILLENYSQELKSDILKAGHHGSKYSSSQEFLATVLPKYVIFSASKDNRFGHPSLEVLERLASLDSQIRIFRTDQQGDIILTIQDNQLKIRTKK